MTKNEKLIKALENQILEIKNKIELERLQEVEKNYQIILNQIETKNKENETLNNNYQINLKKIKKANEKLCDIIKVTTEFEQEGAVTYEYFKNCMKKINNLAKW